VITVQAAVALAAGSRPGTSGTPRRRTTPPG
jgi:hypothetical protein